ncbi:MULTISPECIES: hypothetical protein [unclassified Tatumella]|uniref:hypothetical protein n=1 Tax=unclassified Tatumella TaxID=2649542 RepID=UPI001BAF0519|nr:MULTISPECIES: hypothetical protein [unclassified Tatumella]MBS0856047.1 hypothetical protein [Tatumella sp. JGM16]MBS0913026.1 hypothetical protein [Tatumella sp. JGM91]
MKTETPFNTRRPAECIKGLIAVVGSDGTGKSTLTADIVNRLRVQRPVVRRYLGLISGENGDKIKQLPLIGIWLERRLAAKSDKSQRMSNQAPSLWVALIMYGFSLWRAACLRKTVRLADSGVLVICDRYPQAEISGFYYDGPGIGIERVRGRLLTRLAESERRLYQQMASIRPGLILRLDIDADTAFSRKPDHSYEELQDKISQMQRISYNGARIIELDSRIAYPRVLSNALAAISRLASDGGDIRQQQDIFYGK